jgi:hypothetical protein
MASAKQYKIGTEDAEKWFSWLVGWLLSIIREV